MEIKTFAKEREQKSVGKGGIALRLGKRKGRKE